MIDAALSCADLEFAALPAFAPSVPLLLPPLPLLLLLPTLPLLLPLPPAAGVLLPLAAAALPPAFAETADAGLFALLTEEIVTIAVGFVGCAGCGLWRMRREPHPVSSGARRAPDGHHPP
ncbi:hypothetical protein OVY01_01655 [Robbsia sp. Bb-Pol-6]|uniref:Uncharacterized protein n=2 Tax=Robbsia betulipollinis TaxID=2981849 RepID=A0ABT3ZIZ1_9BURK|nr:hypothetical protein [Robbsia betulipollinis]